MKIKNCRIKTDNIIFNLGYTNSWAAVLYIICIFLYTLVPILIVFLINSYSDYILIVLLTNLSIILTSHLLLFVIRKLGFQIIIKIKKSTKDSEFSSFSIYNRNKIILSGKISKKNFYIEETNSNSKFGIIPKVVFNLILKIDKIPDEIYKLRPEGLILSRWDSLNNAKKEKIAIYSILSL